MTAPAAAPKLVQDDFYRHLFRPFLLPQAAAALLGFSAKHVIRMARQGELRGFDLALTPEEADDATMEERAAKSMIRIQARSVEMVRRPELFRGVRMQALDLADDLLHRRASFSVWEVTHTFDCSDDHVRRLLDAKLLTGPALSVVSERRHIARAALTGFLQGRELHP